MKTKDANSLFVQSWSSSSTIVINHHVLEESHERDATVLQADHVAEKQLGNKAVHMAPKAIESKKKRIHLNPCEYERIVCWFEDLEKFVGLQGSRWKTKVGGGKCLTKQTQFKIMAAELSERYGFLVVIGDEMNKSHARYIDMYKKTYEL